MYTALSRARALWILVAETSVSLEKISDILIQPRIDTEVARKSPVPPRPALQVQALSFKYQQRAEKNTLEEINCLAEPGKFYGLVGRNGSGKSTLVNLLAGFYEPTGGTVSLGGVPLRRVARTELRKRVVMVPQEVYLFNGTIKENIRYANPQATDAQIIEAAKLADIHDFLKDQYLGYNLMIGDQGVNLSGGQKLKVAFARLFLTQPDVILLDEASSALDVETERTIMQHVRERFAESTLISVAHRLHTLREADSIWVMDQGKLVQQGTHSQLSYEEGVYQNFMNTYVNYG
ncbi:MAG: ATP-binding cassette domain-containing protein [Bacteroidota bacterium]